MLRAKRRDERVRQRMEREARDYSAAERYDVDYDEDRTPSPGDDDFDYDKYMADIDRMLEEDPRYNLSNYD